MPDTDVSRRFQFFINTDSCQHRFLPAPILASSDLEDKSVSPTLDLSDRPQSGFPAGFEQKSSNHRPKRPPDLNISDSKFALQHTPNSFVRTL
jgi:hypothetical protein